MTAVETKLFLRDPGGPILVFGLPLGLLLVFGLMPGIREPSAEFGGKSALDTFIAPMSITLVLAMMALTTLPNTIATYREKGVLRRLAASPVSPTGVLTAQLVVNLVAAFAVVLLVFGIGMLALGMSGPENLPGFLLSLVLGTAALFSTGLVVAALASTGRTAAGVGSVLFFPMLALGGVWVPKEKLPAFLQGVADVLPLGATLNSLRAAWAGNDPRLLQLIALGVCLAVCGSLAARFFRWS
ncbi:ABC transporter permease [Amycolatopsis anabasis]|uniref:ABC transporter permease n=1 Tax=Amycolatopsis anabasis TaxID=1840409 RepID=UPI00131A7EDD|nr:ABC transporter permease [Amycolatopsis anabasis]